MIRLRFTLLGFFTCLLTATLSFRLNSFKANELEESFRAGTGTAFVPLMPWAPHAPTVMSSRTPLAPPVMGPRLQTRVRPIIATRPTVKRPKLPPRSRIKMQVSRPKPFDSQDWLSGHEDKVFENEGWPPKLNWLPEDPEDVGWLPDAFRAGVSRLIEMLDKLKALGKIGSETGRLDSGDINLFEHTGDVFKDAEQQMLNDPSSSLARLTELFSTRKAAKMVVMGYAGSGKTETVKLAMALQNEPVTHLNFDMRRWYLSKTSKEHKKAYSKGDEHKKAQLALLKDPMVQYEIKESCRQEIAAAMKSSSTNTIVAFIDEIDLVGAEVLPENIEAIQIWLDLVEEAIGSHPVIQVAVLHPGVAAQGSGQAIEVKGFNVEGAIDFSAVHSEATQAAIVHAVLTPTCENQRDERGMTLGEYFKGSPGAYKRLLTNQDGDISRVHAAVKDGEKICKATNDGDPCYVPHCQLALELAKESGRQGITQQILHDMLFDTTKGQKNAISFRLSQWPYSWSPGYCEDWYDECDMPGAARVGSLYYDASADDGLGGYVMSAVYHDALKTVLEVHGGEESKFADFNPRLSSWRGSI